MPVLPSASPDHLHPQQLVRLRPPLGLADPAERVEAIRGYLHQMEEMEATLQAIRARFDAICQGEVPGGRDWDSIFRFQGYTIDYGIAAARFERDWYARLLCELEEQA